MSHIDDPQPMRGTMPAGHDRCPRCGRAVAKRLMRHAERINQLVCSACWRSVERPAS